MSNIFTHETLWPLALSILLAVGCAEDDDDAADDDVADDDAGDDDDSGDDDTGQDACTPGDPVPPEGCVCDEVFYFGGHCCDSGWQGFECDYVPKTCDELGVPNCVEVWPGEEREGYEYSAAHEVYFFRELSNEDHYFLLMGDLQCDKTCTVFGLHDGNPDVEAVTVLDLNSYTMTYTAAAYESVPNNGFEEWSGDDPVDWTVVSGSVEPRDTAQWMPMHGDNVLYTPGAVVLESAPIQLPAARAYHGYVTVGRAADSDITLEVIGADDQVACSETEQGFFRGMSVACRFDPAQPGEYRLRLTTQGEAHFDRTGIVPLGDYGVALLTSWSLSDENSYQDPIVQNLAGLDIPATGDHAEPDRTNHIEIKNGWIFAGHENQSSYGVRLSGTSRLDLHAVRIDTDGLKSHSVQATGEIHECHLEVHMPWYFARENSDEENVILGGGSFHHNSAIGGQGVIRLKGSGTEIYNNYLRNNAQATNHYAIIHSGAENPEIHHNIFDPIEGSGILTYTGHGYRIHDNVFYVRTATCNVEYLDEDYSTNGIRMNDYGAGTNYDNRVYDNVFHIEGEEFVTEWENCMPVTTGIFYSASGADNEISGNEFFVTKTHADEADPVLALYMGGDAYNQPIDNPLVHDNLFETNDKAAWITTYYGDSADLWLENNTFRFVENVYYTPSAPEAAIQMGRGSSDADNLRLINNHHEGGFDPHAIHFTAVSDSAAYDLTMKWYLRVHVVDGDGQPVADALVRASSSSQGEVVEGQTDGSGDALLVLTEYVESGDMTPSGVHDRVVYTPHSVYVEHGQANHTEDSIMVDEETTLEVTLVGG